MMTVVDADSSGDIDRQELKMYIRSVARVRIMETIKWLLPQLGQVWTDAERELRKARAPRGPILVPR